MRKNILLSGIIIFCIVSSFVFTKFDTFAEQSETNVSQTNNVQATNVSSEANNNDIQANTPMTIPEKNYNQLKNIGKNTTKNKFFKFILAMLGVVFSGLAIYGGLKLYKKLIVKNNILISNPNDERSLESPKDFKTAINIFLNKTDI